VAFDFPRQARNLTFLQRVVEARGHQLTLKIAVKSAQCGAFEAEKAAAGG
jgi:hypothetical protein